MNIITTDKTTPFALVSEIQIPSYFDCRIATDVSDIDNFFNGGLIPGTTCILTAPPGGGKTTLALQLASLYTDKGYKSGIASSEESVFQIAFNSKRLNIKNVEIANKTKLPDLLASLEQFKILFIDSFQGIRSPNPEDAAHKEQQFIDAIILKAQQTGCFVGLICHHTKANTMRGSNYIAHAVDMCMQIDLPEEDDDASTRILVMSKNRFGPPNKMRCTLTSTGYTFNTTASTPPTKTQKNSKTEFYRDILDIHPNPITLSRVMQIVGGDIFKAMTVLREMVLNDKLIKIGRGNQAVYELKSK